ncbi:hypothetical protein [Anditalea andensis]|uniref:Uncharacterized protein n=1 Tax=Anditalea andensis TaxID=1048983 RepID=A0A074LEH7_9BACT|nr:hypothetical protein [Anditalea andensis]KEO72177.1 hypothetical protein EL17_19930 [Anditalea andensis]
MNLIPQHTEVLVSSLTANEVVRRLDAVTKNVSYLQVEDFQVQKIFNGKVKEDTFHLSLSVDSGDTFLPLIHGNIDHTRAGCILFIKYTLFPGSIFFLYFWLVVTFLIGLFFLILEKNWTFALLSYGAGVGNLAFAWAHFNRKVKKSQYIFREMLSLQSTD